jgi:DNA helicase IV
VVKGLELDGVVVVEPERIVTDTEHGIRSLYVALTRSTQRLSVVHAGDLPTPLR